MIGPPPLVDIYDPLDGADSATDIGTNWTPFYSFMKLATNRAQLRTPSSGSGRQGAWEMPVHGHSGGRLLTDSGVVEAQLQAPVGGAATDNATCIGFGPESLTTGGVLVYFLLTTGGNSAILTYTLPSAAIAAPGASSQMSGQTVRSPVVAAVANTALVKMEQRRYSSTATLYQVFLNNSTTPFCTWDDTTGIVPRGATQRRWFMQTEGNFPTFQQAFYSPAISAIRGYDLAL